MILIGKTNRTIDQLKKRVEEGFTAFELYTDEKTFEPEKLRKFELAQQELGVEFISLHTPHIPLRDLQTLVPRIEQTVEDLGIEYVVLHTSFVKIYNDEFLCLAKDRDWIIENTCQTSPERMVELMEDGYNFCLDVAHVFRYCQKMGSDYYAGLEKILGKGREYGTIKLVHFCSADEDQDNLGFKEGIIDIERVFGILRRYYDGYVVVEVPSETMKRDRDYLLELMGN